MKCILVACEDGIVTSAAVTTEIRGKCGDNGIPVSATQCKLLGVESKADDSDLLVTMGKFTGGNVDIPVVGAIPLLAGINEDAASDELLPYLK